MVVALAAALLPHQPLAAASAGADTACRAAMPHYYAALVSSAHGDGEATLRHVVVLAARWREFARAAEPDRSSWPHEAVAGRPLTDAVTAIIESARAMLPRNPAGAHAELERVRVLLRDARARHSVRTFDDALTDYHEAMERLASHTGGRNEIALTSADFVAIRDQAERARVVWSEVESLVDPRIATSQWKDAASQTAGALKATADAAARHDVSAAQNGAESLKTGYFNLLSALARS